MRDYSDLDPSDYHIPSKQEEEYYDYNYIDDKLSTDERKAENYMEWLVRDMSIDGYRREDALDFFLTQFDKAITPVLGTIDERLENKLKEFDLSKFVNSYIEDYQEYAKSRIAYALHYGFENKGYNGDDPRYKEEVCQTGEAYFLTVFLNALVTKSVSPN